MTQSKPLSASGIGLWTGNDHSCQRRHAFVYKLGLREPFAKSAQAGTKVHAFLEGETTEEAWNGYEISKMASLLREAQPRDILVREREFKETIDGVDFTGRIDFETANTVGDYKTTSKEKYVKSLRKLTNDVQRLLYVQASPVAERTLWLYGVWADFSVHPREVLVDRKKDRERFKLQVLAPAEEILAVADDVDPLSLPPTKSACRVYPPAGCPFQDKCWPQQRETSNRVSALIEKLRLDQGPAPADPPAASKSYLVDTLFVDCLPLTQLDEPLVYSWSLLGPASQSVADDVGVLHPFLVEFGKGPAMLAVQAIASLKKQPVKYLYLETRSAEGKAVQHQLMENSRMVVKGFI